MWGFLIGLYNGSTSSRMLTSSGVAKKAPPRYSIARHYNGEFNAAQGV